MSGWLPFVDDENALDPRWSDSFKYLYDNWEFPNDAMRDLLAGDDNPFVDPLDDGGFNKLYYLLSMVPIIGDLGVIADSYRSFTDYMKNNNLTWSDITYPFLAGRRYSGGSVQSVYGSLNFVSSNLDRLYR